MGDLVGLDGFRDRRTQQQQERVVRGLEDLIERARAGEVIGVCFAAVPADRKSVVVGAYKTDDCGAHELVGVSTLLAAYITDVLK
jgi:hypothetical protein